MSRTGIYLRQVDAENDNRPVYKHTSRAYYLYFIQSNGLFRGYWVVGTEVGTTNISLGVEGVALTPDKVSSTWQMWDPSSQSWSPSEKLRAICVDDAFSSCSSGQLRMLRSSTSGSHSAQQRRMGIYDITSGINELRPVYNRGGTTNIYFTRRYSEGTGSSDRKWGNGQAGCLFPTERGGRNSFSGNGSCLLARRGIICLKTTAEFTYDAKVCIYLKINNLDIIIIIISIINHKHHNQHLYSSQQTYSSFILH